MTYETRFYATNRKIDKTSRKDVFLFINETLDIVRYTFPGEKVYILNFIESPEPSSRIAESMNLSSSYFAWKSFEQERYLYLSHWKGGVEICFPYGSRIEEDSGRGKIVLLSLDDCIEI